MADYHIDEVQDYIEVLCQDHTLVNHNMNDVEDGKPFRSFARFQSDEQIRQISNKAGKCIVVFSDFFGQRILHQDDYRIRQSIVLRFGVKKISGDGDETGAINEAIKVAMKVMYDFLMRMQRDAADMCEELRDLEPDLATWDRIEDQPWLDDYYGWDLTLPYRSFMPAYDPSSWRSDETELPVVPAPPGHNASEGKFQLLVSFKVGADGAPMTEDDEAYINAALVNKYVLVTAGGVELPAYVTGITVERYIVKEFANDYIHFEGGVKINEIIRIYTYRVETA